MILIFADDTDHTVTEVCEWLYRWKCSFVRLNGKNLRWEQQRDTFKLWQGSNNINLQEVESVWFRRTPQTELPDILEKSIKEHLSKEYKAGLDTLMYFLFKNYKSLGNPERMNVNKIKVLDIAAKMGIKVPDYLITTGKSSLIDFLNNNDKNIITKSLHESIKHITTDGKYFTQYTERVSNELIETLPEVFGLSFFQKNIEKQADIRTFFIDGKCFSAFIFSSTNSQTDQDFRKYDHANPNAIVPYQLPTSVEDKIQKLMTALDLNTGSLDFVLTPDNELFFLEVNPIGQFGWISKACNFGLEHKVASFIANR